MDQPKELEFRVDGAEDPARLAELESALRRVDETSRARFDAATGIVHVDTSCDSLDVIAALSAAGFEVRATSG